MLEKYFFTPNGFFQIINNCIQGVFYLNPSFSFNIVNIQMVFYQSFFLGYYYPNAISSLFAIKCQRRLGV